MREYRVYLLDEQDKITWGSWIEAADLEDATASAKKLYECRFEIWEGLTRLAVVPARAQNGEAPAR